MKKVLRWSLLTIGTGVLAGIAAAVFLILLAWATDTREEHRPIIWFLPLAGFAIGWLYYRYAGPAGKGNNLILDEIHSPSRVLPKRMAPFVLLGTVGTHLFGGSAGREGTAVQMGASLADNLGKKFGADRAERLSLLVAGAGAGFGAAIGTPLAGAIFGMEVVAVRRLRALAPLRCLIASYVAVFTTHLLHAPHSVYPSIEIPFPTLRTIAYCALAGIAFGLTARFFVYATHLVEKFHRRWVPYPPLRPLLAGIVLVLLYAWDGSYLYAGLGIPVIQKTLHVVPPGYVPWFKLAFTALTIGSGFKGGEFIPMVFIGTTLGSVLSQWLPTPEGLLAALGFAAVFGAGANTPIACTLMAAEIFGAKLAPFALVGCFAAYWVSGHPGIYHAQPLHEAKRERLLAPWRWLGELPKRWTGG